MRDDATDAARTRKCSGTAQEGAERVSSKDELPPLINDRDVLAAYLERLKRHRAEFGAYICDTEKLAIHDLRRVEAARRAGQPLPLDGLPMVIKDILDVAGYPTTAGSRAYGDAPAERDAAVISRLREAGAVILAKSNLHELAYGGTNINPFFGACLNPWNTGYISGGSSGGSAVAVALRDCAAALGTDTGGSGRIPAAFTGVVGMRPTYGAVSRRGLRLLSWSLDTVSIMAQSASIARRVYAVIADHDPDDPCATFPPADFLRTEVGSLERLDSLRILAVDSPPGMQPDPAIDRTVTQAVHVLSELGAEVVSGPLPGLSAAYDDCDLLLKAEAFAAHESVLRNRPHALGEDTVRRLSLGRDIPAAHLVTVYLRQRQWQHRIRLFLTREYDVLAMPTTIVRPVALDDAETITTTARLAWLTFQWSFGHLPAISVPCGFLDDGIPCGLQLVAAPWREATLLRIAEAYQRATSWTTMRPACAA
jgi:aspartyl-tRNA(Asn)/glutamyl-tRNA(Gln) amidotransferase subunit A